MFFQLQASQEISYAKFHNDRLSLETFFDIRGNRCIGISTREPESS